jgi:predicted RNase H-like HicB family nuclease
MAEYLIIIEKAKRNYAAYLPDLPGCVATGATREEVEANIREAVRFHLEGLKAEGLPVPKPTTSAARIAI